MLISHLEHFMLGSVCWMDRLYNLVKSIPKL